ncbi:hypothetical protein QBC46DRAFT_48673 [Diplogelasinospora grovesii]|uniref:Nitrogen regulatory protein areA GATA-like domain-containing protein n=1 Tax=Diplogelasinospora grovesii TaxID=303347 RepID=A0AAN6NCB3_9PEZI|nr:hypothetical protein QBC46DRAFT_48673 [Diplogelasinospora grovesii]
MEGIVENTREIYAEVASYSVVPPEKIWQFWNVYTTTFRRLVDPTAYRLENFWWHVWGSDRQHLSGATLAKLYEEFSTGPTFVPLKGPPNRCEGPLSLPEPGSRRHVPDRHNSEPIRRPEPAKTDPESDQASTPKASASNMKSPGPSAARPPPPHPILKKSRGPSSSGHRPTARFISPQPSEDEAAQDDDSDRTIVPTEPDELAAPTMLPSPLPNPAATVQTPAAPPAAQPTPHPAASASRTPATEMPPPPLPATTKSSQSKKEKSAAPSTKRIVVSTAASKKRPVLPRRQSSHSTPASDAGPAGPEPPRRHSNSNQRPVSGIAELIRRSSQDSIASSPSETGPPVLSAKAAGKRPAKPSPSSQTREVVRKDNLRKRQPVGPTVVHHGFLPQALDGQSSSQAQKQGAKQNQDQLPRGPPLAGFVDRPAIDDRQNIPPGYYNRGHPQRPDMALAANAPIPPARNPLHPPSFMEDQPAVYGPAPRPPPFTGFIGAQNQQATNTVTAPTEAVPQGMVRSQSNMESQQQRQRSRRRPSAEITSSGIRPPLQALRAAPSVITSTTNAQGRMGSDEVPTTSAIAAQDEGRLPDNLMLSSRPSASALQNLAFTPTPRNPAPPPPFGRSRSELKLLLGRSEAARESKQAFFPKHD